MNIKLSDRVQSIKPSPTLAVTARAAAMRAAGKDIVGLGAGEPDFDTPEHIKQAAIKAIQDLHQIYAGRRHARPQRRWWRSSSGKTASTTTSSKCLSCGGKQVYNLAQAFQPGRGDLRRRIGCPTGYGALAGAGPSLSTRRVAKFKITPPSSGGIDAETRLLVINSPSTRWHGLREAELKALGEVLKDYRMLLPRCNTSTSCGKPAASAAF